jgi:hypothetical protein
VFSGGHDPACWREDLRRALPWAMRQLGPSNGDQSNAASALSRYLATTNTRYLLPVRAADSRLRWNPQRSSLRRRPPPAPDMASSTIDGGGPFLESGMIRVSSATWPGARHQFLAIAQRAVEPPVLHAVAVMSAMAATAVTARTRTRPTTPRRGAATAAGAASAGPAAAEGRAGREPVRPWCTHLPRFGH